MPMTVDSDLLNLQVDISDDLQSIIDEMKERPDYDPVEAENIVLEAIKGLDYWPDGVDPNEDACEWVPFEVEKKENVNKNSTLPTAANPRRRAAIRQGCP